MPHYIILLSFTDQGIRSVKDTIKRSEDFKAAIEEAGGKAVNVYYTLGSRDIVWIVEAPNDETIVSLTLRFASLGNARSEILKAFTMNEAAKIIERV